MIPPGDQGCRGYGMRKGERYRKSVRGCIISHQISVLHMIIVKKGDAELEVLTDNQVPRRLGPKRASKLRKLFALSKARLRLLLHLGVTLLCLAVSCCNLCINLLASPLPQIQSGLHA